MSYVCGTDVNVIKTPDTKKYYPVVLCHGPQTVTFQVQTFFTGIFFPQKSFFIDQIYFYASARKKNSVSQNNQKKLL